jgi:hypothetical protein
MSHSETPAYCRICFRFCRKVWASVGDLFQVDAFQLRVAAVRKGHAPAGAVGVFVLADLVALGQVWIEVVLAVEPGVALDLAFERQGGADGHPQRRLVQPRQHAGKAQVDHRYPGVGLAAEGVLGGGEQLGPEAQLDMHLEADDGLVAADPVTGSTHSTGSRWWWSVASW